MSMFTDQYVYNEIHKIVVKSLQLKEKNCLLRITIEIKTHLSSKALSVKITDDHDGGFLFTLLLTQEDFTILKTQQGLRVDFDNFPKQLAKLLTDCKSPEKPQFELTLDDVESESCPNQRLPSCGLFLKVIERNDFKYLCHLSLRMASGSDEDIKQHLITKLNANQELLHQEKVQVQQYESEVNRLTRLVDEKSKALAGLEMRLVSETAAIRLEESQKLAIEVEKARKEREEADSKHNLIVNELRAELDVLTFRNNACRETNCSLESSLKERTMQKEIAEKEVTRLQAVNTELKKKNSCLEQQLKVCEDCLQIERNRRNSAEEAAKNSGAALAQVRHDLQVAHERDNASVTKLSQCERQLHHLSEKLKHLVKGNDALIDELDRKRAKQQQLLTVCRKLEDDLSLANKTLTVKNNCIIELEKTANEKSTDCDCLRTKLDEMEKKVKEQEEMIKKQHDVNTYLHRKLNEAETTSKGNLLNGSSGVALSTSLPPTNRSLPAWLSSSTTGNSKFPAVDSITNGVGGLTVESSRIDPSFFAPAEEPSKSNTSRASGKPSSYFQLSKKSAK